MIISDRNRALLERKCGKRLPIGDAKVTLTLASLGQLLDAARQEGPDRLADPNLQAMLDAVFGKVGR